jgi:PAS domain S-box-containing protein
VEENRKLTPEEALRESENRFKAISESTPVGIGVVADGVFLYVNPAYEKAFGYSKNEVIGKKTHDIYFEPADRDRILKLLKEKGSITDYEARLKRKDGTPFWSLSSIRPIVFDGKPALLGAFIDITERNKAEEEIRRNAEELARFNRAMVGRENRMIELKKEVNELCRQIGIPARYQISSEEKK